MTKSSENLPVQYDPSELLKGNMEGVQPIIPVIGIIHQAQSFKMADGTKEDTLTGIVLDVHNSRSYWDTPFDEGNGDDVPDCYSNDGIMPAAEAENPQAKSCMECVKGKFDEQIRKTPCKRMKQIHILVEGELMPTRLPAPPSSIKAVDGWIQALTSKTIPYQLMRVTMGLKPEKNKSGIEYSELTFKNHEAVTDQAEIGSLMSMRESLLPMMRREDGSFGD